MHVNACYHVAGANFEFNPCKTSYEYNRYIISVWYLNSPKSPGTGKSLPPKDKADDRQYRLTMPNNSSHDEP